MGIGEGMSPFFGKTPIQAQANFPVDFLAFSLMLLWEMINSLYLYSRENRKALPFEPSSKSKVVKYKLLIT